MEKAISEKKANRRGYDKRIFDFTDEDFIFGSRTYRDFIRDKIDFVVVEKNHKFSLMRKSKDISLISGHF